MKKLATVALAAAAAVSMTACADMYGHHDRYAYAGDGVYADGYYDDFYGPVDTGYWGDDGVFMYRGADQQYHRDDSGHFRKQTAQGYHSVHTHAARPDKAGQSATRN
jgi:hypothetical protein